MGACLSVGHEAVVATATTRDAGVRSESERRTDLEAEAAEAAAAAMANGVFDLGGQYEGLVGSGLDLPKLTGLSCVWFIKIY